MSTGKTMITQSLDDEIGSLVLARVTPYQIDDTI
jgi:hypothetical protein